MDNLAIRVEGLGKMYRLGATQNRRRYSTIRDQLTTGAKTTLRKLLRRGRRRTADPGQLLWALQDVSFEVKRGEVVGIIGRNGAGKSTLLKILSKITEPTEGGADIYGRVGSLLEVGTGFNPELTGRENIYLNGAILGMKRAEIARKFDEIVAFAEVEKFLDTPAKRYSSGMYTRLAFAVAAHLEPEILVVDEVLAVGDLQFQKKCLGKMGDVAKDGRTVIFVSHNLAQISRLCTRGVVLDRGRVITAAPIGDAVSAYLTAQKSAMVSHKIMSNLRNVEYDISIVSYRVTGPSGGGMPATGQECCLEVTLRFGRELRNPDIFLAIYSTDGVELIRVSTSTISGMDTGRCIGDVTFSLSIPWLPLAGGDYDLYTAVTIPDIVHLIQPAQIGTFTVEPGDPYKTGLEFGRRYGVLAVPHSWSLTRSN